MKKSFLSFLTFFLWLLAGNFFLAFALSLPPIILSPRVTATVPAYFWLELTGWTSPWAQVELTMGQTIAQITRANDQGQFTFRIALPRELGHFCLMATDITDISSHPLCLPPPPPEVTMVVKQVVMPPTLKIDQAKILKGETVAVSGYTTLDSPVIPFIFEPKSWALAKRAFSILVSPAIAAEAPKPPIKSDQNGFYQFNLPTNTLGRNRLFIGSIFLNNPSPKSNTLIYDLLSWWQMLLARFFSLIGSFLGMILAFIRSLKGLIVLEVASIGGILFFIFWRRKKAQGRQESDHRLI